MPELSSIPGRSTVDAFRAANLRQRVITAVVIGISFLALVLLSSPFWFAIISGAVFLVAAWEWTDLAGLQSRVARVIFLVVFAVMMGLLAIRNATALHMALDRWLLIALSFWCVIVVMLANYPASDNLLDNISINTLAGIIILLPAWLGLVFLKQEHPDGALILLVVAMIAMADIGAYFTGVRFGKHKLAPKVSPGKSWEGVVGGVLFNLLFVAGLTWYFGWTTTQGIKLALVAIAVTAASIVGDLFESMIKRQRGVKDSGTILPGHGGILDRIDGWMAAVPVFTLLYLFGCTGLP